MDENKEIKMNREELIKALADKGYYGTVDRLKRGECTEQGALLELNKRTISKGTTLAEQQAFLEEKAKIGAFGLTWQQIETKQGGKLTR
jgi:hypothetical protein